MKITEYKNEDALDLLADLLDPIQAILSDKDLVGMIKGNAPKIEGIKYALKNYPTEIIEILARLDGVPAIEYDANILKMTATLLEIVNDKELISFFTSSAQTTGLPVSGAVTGSTEDKKV